MKKKVISAILCGAMVLGTVCPVLAADDKSEDTKTEAAAGDSAKGKKIALVGKAAGNAFFEIAAKSFQETVEAEGGEVQVVYPETATADAQIKVLDNLISQDFDAICISANDVNALQAKLEEAMDEGIKVSSFDSAPNKDSREIFVKDVYKRQGVFSIALGAYLPQFPSLVPEFEAQYDAFKKTIPDTVEIVDGEMCIRDRFLTCQYHHSLFPWHP